MLYYPRAVPCLICLVQIYALSDVFEIKPKGSTFASVTTTDLGGPTSSSTDGNSPSPTSGSAQQSSGAAAHATKVTSGLLGVVAGLFAFVA